MQRQLWGNRLQLSYNNTYNIEDFNYLLGTKHRDPDDGFEYIVKAIRKHRGLIVVDRQLVGSTSKKYDTIHALDIKKYYDSQQSIPAQLQYRSGERGERVCHRTLRPRERSVGIADDPRMQPARKGLAIPTGPQPTRRRSLRIADSLATVHLNNFNTEPKFSHIDPSNIFI